MTVVRENPVLLFGTNPFKRESFIITITAINVVIAPILKYLYLIIY
jgi:hypothetical protein